MLEAKLMVCPHSGLLNGLQRRYVVKNRALCFGEELDEVAIVEFVSWMERR